MKVAIYTRVSDKSNRQDAANQSLQLIEYWQRQGWDFIEYTDRQRGRLARGIRSNKTGVVVENYPRVFETSEIRNLDFGEPHIQSADPRDRLERRKRRSDSVFRLFRQTQDTKRTGEGGRESGSFRLFATEHDR